MMKDEKYTQRFLLQEVKTEKKWIAFFLFLALLAAVFEGGTMGLLALVLQVVTSEGSVQLADEYGLLGKFLDNITVNMAQNILFLFLTGLAIFSQILRSASEFGADVSAANLIANVERRTRQNLTRQFLFMSYASLRQHKTGDLNSYHEQVTNIGSMLTFLSITIVQLFLTIAYIAVMFWLSWSMTTIALLAGIVISIFLRSVVRRVRRVSENYKNANVNLSATMVEFLQGLREIHTFGREAYAYKRINKEIEAGAISKRSILIWQSTIGPIIDVLTIAGLGTVLISGYYLAGEDRIAVFARLGVFLFILYRLMPRVSIMNKNWSKMVSLLPFIERIALMLRTDDKQYIKDGAVIFSGLQENIAFKNVSLQYKLGSDWAICEMSMAIPKGSMLGLVGESGAGKSSTIDLLLRLYEPTSGQILVDGTDLSELNWQSWREHLGVVSQDTFIFHATIRKNIAFGKLDASDDEIVRAAKSANAHDFIMEMPAGYDTIVGDQGYGLSGGQRQRISIARAILCDPDVLILDEATSSLDSQSEMLIREALDLLQKDRTVIAIAHRLSTIKEADQIVVLNNGRIVELGDHETLLVQRGHYANMWAIQTGEKSS